MHSLQFNLLRWGEKRRAILVPFSFIWQIVSYLRNAFYDRGWLSIERVGVPVISIGNLSVGGTGKTPLVIALAKKFLDKKIGIIARGYGAKKGEMSDEMRVIARHLPNARLYQGSDRVKLAKQAQKDGVDLIILDDGFQHRRIHRDVDLLIVRPEDSIDRFLPAGRLRDSVRQIKRATFILPESGAKVSRIVDRNGKVIPTLEGEKIAYFCGIGRPERFKKTLLSLGAEIVAEKILADHEPFVEIKSFYEECKSLNIKWLVCTEKDFVKLEPLDLPLAIVEIESEIEEWEKLVAKIRTHIR